MTLFESKCVSMTMDDKSSEVRIVARGGGEKDIGCAVDGLIASTEILLARNVSFSVIWDLRKSPPPDVSSTVRLIGWAIGKKEALTKLTTKMGVLVPEGAVSTVVGQVLQTFAGATPTFVSGDEQSVEAFVVQ